MSDVNSELPKEPSVREQIKNLSKTVVPIDSPYPNAWMIDINELVQLIKRLRAAEVDDFADYLSDIDNEYAFEMGYGEYSYKRIREIDAE